MEGPMGPGLIVGLLPWIIISIPFAIGNYYLAKALNRSVPIWVVLSLIPIVNYFFYIYLAYVVLLHVIRRLGQISSALNASTGDVAG